ncbi:uncharacterized protein LOC113017189 [Astatotilapia calliptera]|uniref:uncharacterized protein LOC113017189 n=1 Tax=Astatotilapia calliptera TaxID=8154 RepID=UPI000E411CDF|nr:uncharacterized protein LOC113017189 [Astatotilapia calliptera]XP_026016140.1 uncharacterized protein LOC113017189 [Astatotilapia calliptera]
MMMEFLRLQKENQIPSSLTAEHMGDLLVERSKETVRVQSPKLLSNVRQYIDLLKERQQDAQTSKLLTAPDVVIEVVPRVLHGFWELPPHSLLNMASQRLSILSTSVTKATLDRVSKSLPTMENQDIFSRSIRGGMVQSILSEVREKYPEQILLNKIANFAPELLRTIADVAKKSICQIFQPTCESPVVPDVLPTKKPHSEGLPKSDVLPTKEPPFESSQMADVLRTEEPASKILSDDLPSEELPSVSLSMSEPVVSITNNSEKSDNIQIKEKKKKRNGFFQKFRALCCCCFRPQETD